MSQISPPVRILLAGAVLFLAAWFTVLRPKADDTVAPPAAATPAATATAKPTDGLGRAVEKARHAAGATTAQARKDAGETTAQTQAKTQTGSATTTQAAQPPIAIPAKVLATLPKDVAAALQAHKTIVLGVIADGATNIRPLADDDRYVRNALRKVNRYDDGVLIKRVPVSSLVQYAPLVGDLHVDQTPSIVVIDGKLHGTVLAGYVDKISINQAIADAHGSTHTLTDPYLITLNRFCTQYHTRLDRWSWPTISGRKALASALERRLAIVNTYRGILARLAAPARWGTLKTQYLRVIGNGDRVLARQAGALKRLDKADWLAATSGYDFVALRRLDGRFNRLGVTSCAIDRRS